MIPELSRLVVAIAPIAIVLLLLVVRLSPLWAGVVGLLAAVAGAVTVFPVSAATSAATMTRLGPTVIEVALILLGGIGLAHLMDRSGAQDTLARWLERAESGADRIVPLLLLIFGMTPFMESVTGFGLGVVITAPLLIRQGLAPVQAVLTGLLGLVLIPWGSLAPGTLVAAQLGGQDFRLLGIWSAVLTLPVLIVSMAAVLMLITSRPRLRELALGAGLVVLQWLCLIAANVALGPPLAGVLASGAVIAGLLAYTRITKGPLPPVTRALRRAITPYLILVAGILSTTLVLALTGDPPGYVWINNPAMWLLLTVGTSLILLGVPRREWPATARRVVLRWLPVAGSAVVFMVLGIVMAAAGMAEHLAMKAAGIGPGFVGMIPAIGAFGGYLTGSNTGAAAMFSAAVTTAAAGLGVSPLIALAGQNVAGSIAIIISPPRVALAVAVALRPGAKLPARAMSVLFAVVATVAVMLGGLVLLLA